jgi:hypothetical protein
MNPRPPDMKVVFFDEWDSAAERLKGATEILGTLAGIADKAAKTWRPSIA